LKQRYTATLQVGRIADFVIRDRFWYNSEKSFNNKSTLNEKRRPEMRKEE
jgi:hypothetical protein